MNMIDSVMVNLPMEERDPGSFAALVGSRLDCGCDLSGRERKHRSAVAVFAVHDASVVFIRSDTALDLRFDRPGDRIVVFLVVSGGIDLAAAETASCQRGEAFAIATDRAWQVRTRPGTRFCAMAFQTADANRLLERLTGRPQAEPLALAARFRSASPLGRMLAALVAAAVAGSADETLARSPQASELLQDGMIALLLENLPHSLAGGIVRNRPDNTPWPIRRAIDYIGDNARREIGVADVAAAAEMSVRALQQNFQRFLKASPQDYIKTVRLQGVRRELLDPGSRRSIEDIAGDWGFVNRGHFATQYRKLYGELPSDTRRSR